MPTYRTNGAWGSGIGVNLTPAQVDENFYDHETRIVSLETTPPTANSIETITASGFTWTVTLTDGTILDPLPVPVVYTVWRGDWQPFTLYSEADLFRVSDQGIFAVMQAHTSAATFDPDAAAGSPLAPLYLLMIGLSSLPADTTLDEISDVTITGVADNDFIAWDAGSALWTNRTAVDVAALLAGLTALDDLSNVDAAAPTLGQVLTWQGSPASWQPADVAATLDELTDVSVPAPGDGDVLTYQAGSPTGWIAAPVPDIPSALDDLTDVAAPAPADGDFLQYQSGSPAGWVNAAGTGISDLGSVSLPLLSTDLILVSEGVGSPPSSYQTRKATIGDLGFTLGSTAITLGGTVTTVAGLTLSSPTLTGAIVLPGTGVITVTPFIGLGTTAPAGFFHAFSGGPSFILDQNSTFSSNFVLLTVGDGTKTINNASTKGWDFVTRSNTNAIRPGQLELQYWDGTTVITALALAKTTGAIGVGGALSPQAQLHIGTTAATARIYNTFTDASNGEWAYLGSWGPTANVATFGADKNGSGTYRPVALVAGGIETARLRTNGDFQQGTGSALATNATGGFFLIHAGAGAPTGVPTNASAAECPMYYDQTNNQLYIYNGGWKQPKTPAGAALVTWQ